LLLLIIWKEFFCFIFCSSHGLQAFVVADVGFYKAVLLQLLQIALLGWSWLDPMLGLQAGLLSPKRIEAGNAAAYNAPNPVVFLLTHAHVIHILPSPKQEKR